MSTFLLRFQANDLAKMSNIIIRDFKQRERGRRRGCRNLWEDWGENAVVTEIHKHEAAPSETIVSALYCQAYWCDFRPLFIRITSCEEVRNQLLISYGEGVLNDHELLLLCDLKRSNILDLPHSFPEFNFDDLETTSACPNFASTNATCPFSLNCSME